MDVNADAGIQDERGVLETIASRLAPTMNVFKPQMCERHRPL